MVAKIKPSGRERTFGEDELIVSKTDATGHITYCNDVFWRISGFSEADLLGQPHNIIRHPEMPRSVFKLLWDTIAGGQEIFAYIVNSAVNGDHYWVLAHVTPSFGRDGGVTGYHSNRRSPRREAVTAAAALYREICAIENANADRKQGLAAGSAAVTRFLSDKGKSFNEFTLSL